MISLEMFLAMKKNVTTIYWAIFVIALLSVPAKIFAQDVRLQLTAEEKDYLASKEKLTIACERSWPPFAFMDDHGQHQGIAIEYHKRLSALIGVPIVPFSAPTWAATYRKAIEEGCDLLSLKNKTHERSRYFDFTTPVTEERVAIIGKGNLGNALLKDFAGQTLAIVKGYSFEEQLRADYPEIRLLLEDSHLDCLLAIARGEAVATIAPVVEANHILRVYGIIGLNELGDFPYGNKLRFGVRKGDPLLLSIMEKALALIPPEERRAIEAAWIIRNENKLEVYLWAILLWGTVSLVAGGMLGRYFYKFGKSKV